MKKKTIQFMKEHGYVYSKKGKTHVFEKSTITPEERKLYNHITEYANQNDKPELWGIK